MVRIGIVVALVALAAMVVAFIDAALTPRGTTGVMPKWAWMIVIVLLPVIGAVLWWYAGRPRASVTAEGSSSAQQGRPGGAGSSHGDAGGVRPTTELPSESAMHGMTADERIAWLEQQLSDLEEENDRPNGGDKSSKGDQ
ncbi:PLD nuclease N-terminal domain-containing protein [Pseudoclavibacter sp. CFCC 11306]|uniref:PLD nuclease N-terminal domain-containing protein n=1 Tax=Pseudoclavibacter sp. CFCC 11306 TaxID=1564493 RepID=UPI001300CC07|nr:PLD nuclease N-terminal domain-containing protein [Pseudoclavibacter sp. CFCC 11306]KAB1657530.1 PLDc_N domain-containing protein [Pseudoclavibacter sp. CFCC 11306]